MSGGAGGAVIVAVAIAIVGLCTAASLYNLSTERRLRARLARMKAAKTARIADIVPGETVEIAGVAHAPADAPLLESGLSGKPCLFYRVQIKESQGSSITHLATHTDATDLLLDDDSGALARVLMKDATVELTQQPTEPGDGGRAALLLAELGIRKATKDLLWFEEIIEPGANLYVLGASSTPESTETEGAVFRDGRRVHVVVEKPPDAELLVSVGDEAALATSLREQMTNAGRIGNGFLIATLVLGGFTAFLLISFLSS